MSSSSAGYLLQIISSQEIKPNLEQLIPKDLIEELKELLIQTILKASPDDEGAPN